MKYGNLNTKSKLTGPWIPKSLYYRTDTCAAICCWRIITELYKRFNNRYGLLFRLSRSYDSYNMAVEEKTDSTVDEIEWNVDTEVQLFYAMYGHKPVGKI